MTTLIPKYTQVNTANRTIAEKFAETISVKDFGAIGDGIADDTAAINAAINYFQLPTSERGGEIYFPVGKYRVTSTIEVYNARGLRFTGSMGSVNSSPLIADGVNSSFIFGDGIANPDPVFYMWAGSNVEFRNLIIFGARGSDSVTKALACVWIDFNHENYRFYGCKFGIASIGIRVCSSYNYSTGAWTPGVSAYDGTTFAPSTLVGGFACDNGVYEDCFFSDCSIAGLTIESAQALNMASRKCIFATGAYQGVYITGCQGISFYDPLITGNVFLLLNGKSSIGNIIVNNAHLEDPVLIPKLIYHITATPLGQGITLNSCGGGLVYLQGSLSNPRSCVTINDSIINGVVLDNEGMNLIVNNTTMTTFTKNTAATSEYMRLTNVNITGSINANWNGTFDSLIVEHCNIVGYPALSNVPLKISGRTAFDVKMIAGQIGSASATGGMEGLVFHSGTNSAILCVGCYYNASNVLIATATSGGQLVFNNTGLVLSKFTGATIGTTPSLTSGAYT